MAIHGEGRREKGVDFEREGEFVWTRKFGRRAPFRAFFFPVSLLWKVIKRAGDGHIVLDRKFLPERFCVAASAGVRDWYSSVYPWTRCEELACAVTVLYYTADDGTLTEDVVMWAHVTVILSARFCEHVISLCGGRRHHEGAYVMSFRWPASNSAAVVNRAPKKGHRVHALRSCLFFFFFFFAVSPSPFLSPRFFFSLFAFLLFCPTTPLQFSEKRHRPTFTLHQQRGLFPTTDSYRVQRREKFAGFHLSNFWHFFLFFFRICIWFACVLSCSSS